MPPAARQRPIMLGWGIAALNGNTSRPGAPRGRSSSRAGSRRRPWHWAATLVSSAPTMRPPPLAPRGPARTPHPSHAVLQNNPRGAPRDERRFPERRGGARAALRRGPVTAPNLEPGRHPLPQRQVRGGPGGVRAGRAKLAPDLRRSVFQARQHRLQARDKTRARESWGRATELNPGHELARANLEMLDMTP